MTCTRWTMLTAAMVLFVFLLPAGRAAADGAAGDPPADSPVAQEEETPVTEEQPEQPPAPPVPDPLPIDVALVAADTIIGWDHAAEPVRGWTVHEGRLSAVEGASALLSGYSLHEAELRFDWTVAPGAALRVLLPAIPDGPVLAVTLREGEGCGAANEGGKRLHAGASAAPRGDDEPHSALLRRRGKHLELEVDGRPLWQVEIDPQRRLGLGLAVDGAGATVERLRLAEPLGPPIFNGENLDGWWTPGRLAAWEARDGEIVLVGSGGNYLRSERLYGNFTMSFEYWIAKGGNSGLGIRTARDGWPSGDGMELQILDRPTLDGGGMMSIYRNVPPLAIAHRSEEWNQVVVKAEGWMISAWMNGVLVQQVNTRWEPELRHRHLAGWVGFQDHGAKTRIRNIRLTEAPDGAGLAAWYAPRPETGAALVLDRLMNPERLSRRGLAGGLAASLADAAPAAGEPNAAAAAEAPAEKSEDAGAPQAPAERVLAQWSGPGAVVRFSFTDGDLPLAFYFDGEEQPRLECRAGELHRRVPRLPGADRPLLTYVPFAKSLKVVARGDGGGVRIEAAPLPKESLVRSFPEGAADIPRGMMPALDYRLSHHQGGTLRQHDPYERITSERVTVPPGERVELAALDGAGLVQWIRLQADRRAWEANDLWIEVRYDGEPAPSLAAPARYFFAGVVAGGRHGNYVLTDSGGPVCRLAMPFGSALRVAVVNQGAEPIGGVVATLSVQRPGNPDEAKDFAGRWRLRGTFVPGVRFVGYETFGPPEPLPEDAEGDDIADDNGEDDGNAGDAPDNASDDPSEGTAAEPAPEPEPVYEYPQGVDAVARTLLTRQGRGRWVAMIVADAPRINAAVAAVTVDGKPLAGFAPVSLGGLLGVADEPPEFRGPLSGRQGGLAWRYFLLAPLAFERSIEATVPDSVMVGDRLMLFYAE